MFNLSQIPSFYILIVGGSPGQIFLFPNFVTLFYDDDKQIGSHKNVALKMSSMDGVLHLS